MKLLAVDGNSIANRAFYGIKILTTKSGEYTNAIYGFMNILLKAESDEQRIEGEIPQTKTGEENGQAKTGR